MACGEAGAQFLRVSNREDEFFVVQFGERPKLAVPLTNDIERVRSGFLGARPIGRTSLLDAIEMSLAQMKRVHNTRKAMIILSDGGDNHSRATEAEIKKAVREADVQIYTVGIFDRNESAKRPPEELNGPSLLADLARETGGEGLFRRCGQRSSWHLRTHRRRASRAVPSRLFSCQHSPGR